MSNALRAIQGMHDVLPEESASWQSVEDCFGKVLTLYGFLQVRTPCLEPTPLFARAVGEATEVVEKEMYAFLHHGHPFALRPEATAGAVRAYVQHRVHTREPITRWYYVGPMFRAERPQRGRCRQFHQLGAELFGDPGPGCEAELLDAAVLFLARIGIPHVEILVNSLGSRPSRMRYREALVGYLTPHHEQLSEESQRRLVTNPLRILDSKHPGDQELIRGAPSVLEFLEESDTKHFAAFCGYLDQLGIAYRVEPTLVRGLDYYTQTLFEIKTDQAELGTGNTLLGGGRYDGLVQELGGPDTPAVGFAAGLERLLLASAQAAQAPRIQVFVIPLDEVSRGDALVLGQELRQTGVICEVDTRGGSLKSILRRAHAAEAPLALILGEREREQHVLQLKNLAAHTQEEIPQDTVLEKVLAHLQCLPREGLISW